MNFLLTAVNAKYIHSNPALYSMRSYVGEEYRKHVQIAEYTINNRLEEVLEDIYKRSPDVIGFSCYIWNWGMIQDILVELHKLRPDLPIWLGGPEVSFDAEEILHRYPMITGVMVGEGEVTFSEILDYYVTIEKRSKDFHEKESKDDMLGRIHGLVLPTGTTAERELTDISKLPFLYEDLKPFENRIIYYESSRGCPYHCSYCLSSIDKKLRIRDTSVVKKELQFFLDSKVPQVKFVDRTFNCNHTHAMEIWSYIQKHDNGITNFHFELAADILQEEEIKLLHGMRPGLIQLEIGVQSVNPETLKEICRVMDLDRLERNVKALKQGNNIHIHLDLIAGLPFEDYDSFAVSFNRVYAMGPEQLQLGFLKVLKGSYMHDKVKEYGISYLSTAPYEVLYTKWLPYEKVMALKKVEAMVELYYNSNQFICTLSILVEAFATPFAMYEALAEFYTRNGYFVSSPARSYRYEILFQFALAQEPEKKELYTELLTYDLYLRENMKNRPQFLKDIKIYKEELKGYHKDKGNRNLIHVEPFAYPVWISQEGGAKEIMGSDEDFSRQEARWFAVFDYERRSPLTYEAEVTVHNR